MSFQISVGESGVFSVAQAPLEAALHVEIEKIVFSLLVLQETSKKDLFSHVNT